MSRTYRRHPDHPWDGKKFRNGSTQNTMAYTPSWYIQEFMNRPKRRDNKRLCYRVLSGADPDNIAWPLGNTKPHRYYW